MMGLSRYKTAVLYIHLNYNFFVVIQITFVVVKSATLVFCNVIKVSEHISRLVFLIQ